MAVSDTFAVSGNIGNTIAASAVRTLVAVKDQYGVAYDDTSHAEARITYTNIPAKLSVEDNNTTDAALKLTNSDGTTTAGTYTVGVTLTYNSGVTFTETLVVTVVSAPDTIAPTVVSASTTKIAAAGTVSDTATYTLTFSEALSSTSQSSLKTLVESKLSTSGSSTLTVEWNSAGTVLTIVFTKDDADLTVTSLGDSVTVDDIAKTAKGV